MPDYLVTISIPEVGADHAMAIRERIISAPNQPQAIAFAVQDSITCERLSVRDAMRLAKAGVEVESAA